MFDAFADGWPRHLLAAHAAATLFLVGLIWFVQIVHYPLFARVGEGGEGGFAAYERAHARRTGRVVVAPMFVEAFTGALLLAPGLRPPGVSADAAILGAVLILVIWLSTFALQVPCHRRLARGFDPDAHRRLVRTNWIRTIAWSVRGAIVLRMVGAL